MRAMAEADPSEPLYTVAPADFVRERTALAKALKAAGKREEAARLEKLPRPSPSVWAVNQLARREPALIARLVDLTARLQGHGAPATRVDYAETVAEHREALKTLRGKADEILQAAKIRPTPEILGRVVHDLRAGAVDDESRALLERGRLVRDLGEAVTADPFGSGALVLLPDEARDEARAEAPATPATDDVARARAAAARAERTRAVQRLREALHDAEQAAETEERAWEAARAALATAEKRLAAARAKVEAAAAKLAAAERDDD
jgi:hypothetical protein